MATIIKNVRISDPCSSWNGALADIKLDKGTIVEIEEAGNLNGDGIDFKGSNVSPGWCDLQCHSGVPGYEYRENHESLLKAAAKGGFTALAIQPSGQPCTDSAAAIKSLLYVGKESTVEIYPIGAATKGLKGEQLSEMLDLLSAGACAISQGVEAIHNSDLIFKILQYLSSTGKVFIHRGYDKYLASGGLMNESRISTYLGLKGIPNLAEELAIIRDLKLAEKSGGLLHLTGISTQESVEHLRVAKAQSNKVTASIAAHQLAFTDEALVGFDSCLKVKPPFRTDKDLESLKVGLLDGSIDAVYSDHTPLSEEEKELEFDKAYFGITGLETAFSVLNTFATALSTERLVELLSVNPRKILGLPEVVIEKGAPVNLTFFNRATEVVYSKNERSTLSKNCPFYEVPLKGKVIAIALGEHFIEA